MSARLTGATVGPARIDHDLREPSSSSHPGVVGQRAGFPMVRLVLAARSAAWTGRRLALGRNAAASRQRRRRNHLRLLPPREATEQRWAHRGARGSQCRAAGRVNANGDSRSRQSGETQWAGRTRSPFGGLRRPWLPAFPLLYWAARGIPGHGGRRRGGQHGHDFACGGDWLGKRRGGFAGGSCLASGVGRPECPDHHRRRLGLWRPGLQRGRRRRHAEYRPVGA